LLSVEVEVEFTDLGKDIETRKIEKRDV